MRKRVSFLYYSYTSFVLIFSFFFFSKLAIGEKCSRASECFVEENMDRVECRNAVCTCKYEFNKDSEKQQCIRIVAKSEYLFW